MVVDASAIVVILQNEPESESFARIISTAPVRRISALNWFEASIVAERGGELGRNGLADIFHRSALEIAPIDLSQVHYALQGWRKYGKGRHRAGLNFGDCFAYALAKSLDEPLLFKGDDFRQTDVTPAI